MKVKELPAGAIVWYKESILGIKDLTLPEIFDDCDCDEMEGNSLDYALDEENEYSKEQLSFINEIYLGDKI